MIRAALLLALLFMPAAVRAEEPPDGEKVVAGLSQNDISITTSFNGVELLVFGAVKREAPPPSGKLQVIVTVEGPSQKLAVRRKARRFGIWMNVDSVSVSSAPSFYAVATSAPWDAVITETDDLRWKVSIPRAIRSVGATVEDSPVFTEALIRIRSGKDYYQFLPESVTVEEETLFSTAIALPANLIEGTYRARIFLTRNGQVIDVHSVEIGVQKAGLERWLYRLSQEQPLAYGILAIVLAISAGWTASAAFRFIRF